MSTTRCSKITTHCGLRDYVHNGLPYVSSPFCVGETGRRRAAGAATFHRRACVRRRPASARTKTTTTTAPAARPARPTSTPPAPGPPTRSRPTTRRTGWRPGTGRNRPRRRRRRRRQTERGRPPSAWASPCSQTSCWRHLVDDFADSRRYSTKCWPTVIMSPHPYGGSIKRWCAPDVYLTTDVCLSVAHIGPKSRTERPRKTKIGTEVAHVTRDSNITFKVKRSQRSTCRGRGHIVAACRTACSLRPSEDLAYCQ